MHCSAFLLISHLTFATAFYPGAGNFFGIPNRNATYDYVVVGGGTAGLGVAMRLAENSSYTVAVVEGGGFYQIEAGNQSVVPLYNSEFATLYDPTAIPSIDWGFVTTPQAGGNNRSLHYARGKTLGGSSALNANIYNRGTRGSYQKWAELVGDDSYEFDNWLPFFAKGTNYTFANTDLRAKNASVPTPANVSIDFADGPVHISYPHYALPFTSWVNRAFYALGFKNITSFSDGELLGAQYAPSVLQPFSNQRETSETSYLQAAFASGRENLKVYTHTLGMKILFEGEEGKSMRANKVEVRTGTKNYFLEARREVILSAGAFQSPQLLMVSGIGPAKTLEKHNITVLVDRPGVGQDMWDHIDMEVTYRVAVDGLNTLTNPIYATEQATLFNHPPASSIYGNYGADYIGWEKLPDPYRSNLSQSALNDLSKFPDDWPEVEFEIASVISPGIKGDYSGYGTFVVVPVTPLSRGNVTLETDTMLDPPIINPNWLTSPTDKELALQALKRGREIISSATMKPVLVGDEYMPGKSVQTDEELDEWIRNNFFMNWHAACTCKMGKVDDPMAVVDSKARVIGVDGLRVVDSSSFALLPPGHPVSTVYGLAEKISADIIAARDEA